MDTDKIVRDEKTKALFNTDVTALQAYKNKRDQYKKINELEKDINSVKDDLLEIKDMLKQIIKDRE